MQLYLEKYVTKLMLSQTRLKNIFFTTATPLIMPLNTRELKQGAIPLLVGHINYLMSQCK